VFGDWRGRTGVRCNRRYRSVGGDHLLAVKHFQVADELCPLFAHPINQRLGVDTDLFGVRPHDAVKIDAVGEIGEVAVLERVNLVQLDLGTVRDLLG
jgi:hypothetical protein